MVSSLQPTILVASSDWPTNSGPIAWEAYQASKAGRPPKKLCPACGDQKFVLTGDIADGGKLIPCPMCAGQNKARWLSANCGLEPRERSITLANYQTEFIWPKSFPLDTQGALNRQRADARKTIVSALDKQTGIFTFWGDYGSGKSHALYVIVSECLQRNVEAFYSTTAGVLDHLRTLIATQRQAQHEADPDRFWQRLLNVPVLCIDEVDRFNATDWATSQFFTLIDTRYRRRNSHLTAFATNKDPKIGDDEIGYLFSRMRESTMIRLQGDLRQMVR